MAGRFPGASSVEALWKGVLNGVESLTRFSDDELREAGINTALLNNPAYVKMRGIVEGIDQFDAAVFGFSPREAERMDPQHRLMLETAWQTLEHAGYDSQRYSGRIGVFAGTTPSTYQMSLHADRALWESLNTFETHIGNEADALSTRISYKLNLNGPSIAVQTFCSSSAVAIHLACQSLRTGESDMALAGGVSLRVPSKQGHLYERGNQGSPDGHTRTFDARAQGTVFSDGVAMVLLKRLEDAERDGDTIHAVIKGTAINNDGSLKVGFTAPSVDRQAEVIALALKDAGLSAADIHYIEAHGTATELGDPIEVAALSRAFGQSTSERQFCALGSIKTNIGHTDRAAGVTGVIKAVHVLKSGLVPPTLHFERPNPKMDLENSPFFVSNQLVELPAAATPRRAGVTALGVGGTNAHIVLEQAPELPASEAGRPWKFLTLSAKTPTSLDRMRENLAAALETDESLSLADAAFTLQCGRREFSERLAVLGRDRQEMVRALREPDAERCFRASGSRNRPVAFLFPGVGEQYLNMGAGLYRELPAFARRWMPASGCCSGRWVWICARSCSRQSAPSRSAQAAAARGSRDGSADVEAQSNTACAADPVCDRVLPGAAADGLGSGSAGGGGLQLRGVCGGNACGHCVVTGCAARGGRPCAADRAAVWRSHAGGAVECQGGRAAVGSGTVDRDQQWPEAHGGLRTAVGDDSARSGACG